jgi:drug/metabolite transporter (DMT)-like permease
MHRYYSERGATVRGLDGIHWAMFAVIALVVAVGQILFKITSLSLGSPDNSLTALLKNSSFWIAIILYGAATVAWILAIRSVPISRAYMFMALTYVFVPILSAIVLKEQIGMTNVVASFLIISGIIISAWK